MTRTKTSPDSPAARIETLAIDEITHDRQLAARKLDRDLVADYQEQMAAGDQFPPLLVTQDGGRYWLVDGQHRLEAARSCRLSSLSCEIRQGDRRAALLASVSVNATHGLRRTNADKRRAVAKLLDDREWSKWSAREIARRCRVSDGLVADMQAERAAARNVTADSRSEKAKVVRYTHKHGKPTVMKINAGKLRIDPAMEKGRHFREAVEQLLGFKPHGVLDDPSTAGEILANSEYDLDRIAEAIGFIQDALDITTRNRAVVTCR